MKPSRPVRKSVNVETDAAGKVRAGSNSYAPTRKSAQAFGSVDKNTYKRPSVGITPEGTPVNDKDAGRGTGNARGAVRKRPSLLNSD